METVCFTGHRDIGDLEHAWLWKALQEEVECCILSGATVFRAGGALGFDTMAASCVLQLKEKYPEIKLALYLPCPDQAKGWRADSVRLYEEIKQRADSIEYISPFYFRGVMQKRNRTLVEGADLCIAFLREEASGGTAYTVSYAQKRRVPVINLENSRTAL